MGERIIAAADLSPDETVIEIGPGRGTLTRAIAARVRRVIAVEKDRVLAATLRRDLHGSRLTNVSVVAGDILQLYPEGLDLPPRFRVVANIPYYLTSRLIRILLERQPHPYAIHLMVQREVAERMIASPPKMNLLAIAVQFSGVPRVCFRVAASAFTPRPHVESAFIGITEIREGKLRHPTPDAGIFFAIVRAAFRGKRKTLENSISQNLGIQKVLVATLLARHALAGRRAETLTLSEWIALVRDLAPLVNGGTSA